MIGYILEGVGPMAAAADKRMARLSPAGPWQYQMHPDGTLATYSVGKPVSLAAFGPERKTTDGLRYLPPAVLPTAAALLRPAYTTPEAMAKMSEVVVSRDTGAVIHIMAAFRTPRQILEDDTYGPFTTKYGRAVMEVLTRADKDDKLTIQAVQGEILECCRLAIMHVYRVTRELISDLGWLSEETMLPIWEGAIQVPKRPGQATATA